MREHKTQVEFHSPLGDLMAGFIQEKQALGYGYDVGIQALRRFDRFLCSIEWPSQELPRDVVERWTAKRAHEQPGTHKLRMTLMRQFLLFLRRQDLEVHLPDATKRSVYRSQFTPYIFLRQEVQRLLQAVDGLRPDARCPLRHVIMPEVFRLLYGCGLRLGEVLHLRVADVDLGAGILTVRGGKFNKDRLVPVAPSMVARLCQYAAVLGKRDPSAVFFPAPDGGPYSLVTVYGIFRRLLRECGLAHGGRGKGPRLHDLRHAFAVHRLENWYRAGVDLEAKLPVLAVYMGHRSLAGTQRYLRLTPELFPDIRERLEVSTGHVIPRRDVT
jgi:integrase/recombinase XerD